jgi:hypothetical protein
MVGRRPGDDLGHAAGRCPSEPADLLGCRTENLGTPHNQGNACTLFANERDRLIFNWENELTGDGGRRPCGAGPDPVPFWVRGACGR